MRISQQIVENKLNEVPDEIRAHVTSDEVAETLGQIAKAHGLHIDQAGILDEETLYVMLGLESGDEFVNRVRDRLGISENDARTLVQDINEQIFLSIRKSLMNMHEEESEMDDNTQKTEIPHTEPVPIEPLTSLKNLKATPELPEGVSSKEDLLAEIEKHAADIPPLSPKPAETAPKQPEKPKSYSVDPYREPLI